MGIEILFLHEIVFGIDEFLTPPKTTANYTIRTRTYPLPQYRSVPHYESYCSMFMSIWYLCAHT